MGIVLLHPNDALQAAAAHAPLPPTRPRYRVEPIIRMRWKYFNNIVNIFAHVESRCIR